MPTAMTTLTVPLCPINGCGQPTSTRTLDPLYSFCLYHGEVFVGAALGMPAQSLKAEGESRRNPSHKGGRL